jgi:adenylate cyclase class 2
MEIEVKAKVSDLAQIKKKLIELGAEFTNSEQQDDSYFKPKGREMEDQGPGSFIVRIRKGSAKSFLTLKEMSEETGVWPEYETAIENPGQAMEILLKMGYSHLFDINKKREKGMLDEIELCLDNVKQLGKYLEIAIEADAKEGAKQKIMALFQKIGVNEIQIEPKGYARIISENMGIKFRGVK